MSTPHIQYSASNDNTVPESFPEAGQASSPPSDPIVPISFFSALLYWLKLGFISFGGPAGQISLMHQELVEKRRWISEKRFLHALNYTLMLPGPEAQQLATYMGWLLHGTWGGLTAGLLFILPSFVLLVGLSWGYLSYGHLTWVMGIFYGIKPAVTAIVLFAVYRMASRVLTHWSLWGLAIFAFIALLIFNLSFPVIILSAALLGVILATFKPDVFAVKTSNSEVMNPSEEAWINDETRLEHTVFRWSFFWKVCGVGVLLWLGAMLILVALSGWQSTLSQMAWFFTKAAWLTFGGAYAVLPYVYQGGVETFGWLTAPQMIDGLALGETTPGPLIMVVTFIGFVGGWTHTVLGSNSLFLGGLLAALVVTFFTFLPSFLLIFAGAPLVEASRHNLKLSAPLMAISGALVGVMLNLAVFFAYHVFWQHGFKGTFDWLSAVIMLLAIGLLFWLRWGVISVIAVCGAVGWGVTTL